MRSGEIQGDPGSSITTSLRFDICFLWFENCSTICLALDIKGYIQYINKQCLLVYENHVNVSMSI